MPVLNAATLSIYIVFGSLFIKWLGGNRRTSRSAFVGIPVKRKITMTGEITRRYKVVPVGGIKEKLMAALRYGVKAVVMPAKNKPDLEELPEEILEGMEIIPIEELGDIIDRVLI